MGTERLNGSTMLHS